MGERTKKRKFPICIRCEYDYRCCEYNLKISKNSETCEHFRVDPNIQKRKYCQYCVRSIQGEPAKTIGKTRCEFCYHNPLNTKVLNQRELFYPKEQISEEIFKKRYGFNGKRYLL
jgi:hypothetical protein